MQAMSSLNSIASNGVGLRQQHDVAEVQIP
jgi:hypothetical protein